MAWQLSSIIQCVFVCMREREREHVSLTHGKVLLFALFSHAGKYQYPNFFFFSMLTLYFDEWQRTFSLSLSVCLLWQHSDTRCFVLFIGEQALVLMPAGNLYRTACLIHSVGGKHPGYSLALFSPFSAERSTYCVKAMHRNKIGYSLTSSLFKYDMYVLLFWCIYLYIYTLQFKSLESLRFCFGDLLLKNHLLLLSILESGFAA